MAWQDRQYHRDDQSSSGGFRSRLSWASITTWLLIINAAVFVLDGIFTGSTRAGALSLFYWGNFNINHAVHGLQLWRFFTYQFLHVDFPHILFNMFGLYFFGPLVEQWWGLRRFLAFYLLCGISGALVYWFMASMGVLSNHQLVPLIGASGSIFGILIAAAVAFPHMQVRLLIPPIPMTMRTMALVFLVIAAVSLLAGSRNAGGEAAHLGGAALGFLFTKFPWTLDWADLLANRVQNHGPNSWDRKLKAREKEKRRQEKEQAQVDRILDKVKTQGLAALTDREKQTLRNATDRQRG
jgi:membrane associated rhomboid family serine protease